MAVSSFPWLWVFTNTSVGAVERSVFVLREFELAFPQAAARRGLRTAQGIGSLLLCNGRGVG
jgi:hypothetical protein